MKTAHAIAHGTVTVHGVGDHRASITHDALGRAERTVCAVAMFACEAVILWILLSSIYFAAWPVQ